MRIVSTLLLLCLLPLFTGCPSSQSTVNHEHTHDHAHEGHAHEGHGHAHGPHPVAGPHNGHLIELGDEAYHLEWTHDDEAGEVTVYVLDGAAKEVVPIESDSISIVSVVEDESEGEKTTEFKLSAVNASGEPPMAAEFSLSDPALLMSINMAGQGAKVTVPVTIDGQEYVGKFEKHDHSHAGHNH